MAEGSRRYLKESQTCRVELLDKVLKAEGLHGNEVDYRQCRSDEASPAVPKISAMDRGGGV